MSEPPAPARQAAVSIGIFRATGRAFLNRSLDYHPRVDADGKTATLTTQQMLAELNSASAHWDAVEVDDKSLDLARQSLDEVKAQTEYQDQKATRLLTVTTFLSAFSGVLFTRFIDSYRLGEAIKLPRLQMLLVLAAYIAFALFVLAAVCGALVTFHATRTRFKYTDIKEPAKEAGASGYPKSRLFYGPILGIRPEGWMKSFVDGVAGQTAGKPALALSPQLKLRYFRDLILETYLIAAKTADKLRYLGPAQSLLATSLRCLLIWLILAALAALTVTPAHRPETPREVRLIKPEGALPVRVVPTAPPRQTGPAGAPPPAANEQTAGDLKSRGDKR